MTAAVEPGQYDDAEEVAEVQRLRGGVEAAVDLDRRGARVPKRVAGDGLDQTAFFEDFNDVAERLLEGAGGFGGFCGPLKKKGRRMGFEGTQETFG